MQIRIFIWNKGKNFLCINDRYIISIFFSRKLFFLLSYWRVAGSLQNTRKLKPIDKAGKGGTLRNLGIVYQSLGD